MNPFAEKIKQENLARKMGIEESTQMVKDSLWRWNGRELVKENNCFVDYALLVITFALLVLAIHHFIIMPLLN